MLQRVRQVHEREGLGDPLEPARQLGDGEVDAGDELQREHDELQQRLRGLGRRDQRRDEVGDRGEAERAGHDGQQRGDRAAGREPEAVAPARDGGHHPAGHDGGEHRRERARRDEHPRGARRRAAPLEHAELALGDDGHRERHEARREHREAHDPRHGRTVRGHQLARDLDRGGVEQAGEADEQDERQRQAEELHPPVAAEREQVEAQLVREQGGHRVSSR